METREGAYVGGEGLLRSALDESPHPDRATRLLLHLKECRQARGSPSVPLIGLQTFGVGHELQDIIGTEHRHGQADCHHFIRKGLSLLPG